ncbi:MAG: AAA family ATPase [Bosea sp. (in: a-proteobacteria)]|uniref:AAA family ATPase n=1 Tax=Bosea sp. (in: a-proteobacteria) TaxID=1871050 RepID=UPI003F7C7036
MAALPRLERIVAGSRIRWGLWADQYIVPFDQEGHPVLSRAAVGGMFCFEPDNIAFVSDAVYRVNRRWEHFVCPPHRRIDGEEGSAYRMIAHKRPSALDHAAVGNLGGFVGRTRELAAIDRCFNRASGRGILAILANAGSGKTRLIGEWLARHPATHALRANFSLFGGDVESFAGQLAELPQDRLDVDALVAAVMQRLGRDRIGALVLDDIHWAGDGGQDFVRRLLVALAREPVFFILASRPQGRHLLEALQPDVTLDLKPLARVDLMRLARELSQMQVVATEAVKRSKGNPLFVEQFAAWAAESGFQGGASGPVNLHQVVGARIRHLCNSRIGEIDQRLRWSHSWQRPLIDAELSQLETEAGLWLDRLETGDYADRVEAARHLNQLERLDYAIFITSMVAGRQRPRSSRLREAIERLLIGSSDQILTDLRERASRGEIYPDDVAREAERAGNAFADVYDWKHAGEFFALACSVSRYPNDLFGRLETCRQHMRAAFEDDDEVYALAGDRDIEANPSVGALDLPYVWITLGRRFACGAYFRYAEAAAEAINDKALAAWSGRMAMGAAVLA